jgi:hypothetical protein
MELKSVFKPEGSYLAGLGIAGAVYAIYQLDLGPVANVHASDPNHPVLETTRKKAAYTSFILVAGLTLLTKDQNVGVLGFGTIIAMELHYRHAIMSDPVTGVMQPPSVSSYQNAYENVPVSLQGQTG